MFLVLSWGWESYLPGRLCGLASTMFISNSISLIYSTLVMRKDILQAFLVEGPGDHVTHSGPGSEYWRMSKRFCFSDVEWWCKCTSSHETLCVTAKAMHVLWSATFQWILQENSQPEVFWLHLFITVWKCSTCPPGKTVRRFCALSACRAICVCCSIPHVQGQERWGGAMFLGWAAEPTQSPEGSASVWTLLSDISFTCQYRKLGKVFK